MQDSSTVTRPSPYLVFGVCVHQRVYDQALAFPERSGPFPWRLFTPNRCGEFSRDLQAEALGYPRSQIGVDRVPVGVDCALLNEALDPLAHVSDDIGDQVLPVRLREHLAVEIARLHEVVVLRVWGIGAAHDLPTREPARFGIALRVSLRAAVAVGCVDGLVAVVAIAHRAVLIVAMHFDL